MTLDFSVTLICVAVVAFYASSRYNTPETNRFSTTRSLFWLTTVGYVAASLSTFFLLCEVVLKPGVLSFLGIDHAQEIIAKYSAPPVLAAALLTTLLPNVAYLREFDAWILKRFQAWGRIPWGVRRLADTLTLEAYLVDESDIVKLRTWINDDDDVPSELASRVGAEATETERGRLARILGIYRELKRLNISSPYASAFRERQDAWLAIQSEFQVFVAQSQAFFILFDHLTPIGGSAGEDASKKAKHFYRLISLTVHRRMVEFLAQLLLVVEGSDARIRIQLQAVGFNVLDPVCPPLPLGPFAFMGVMMIIAILGMVSVMPSQPKPLPLGITAVLIGTTKTIALLAAILPKLRWKTFRPDNRGNFPFLPWIASAGFAGVISLLIDRTALAIAVHRFSSGLDFLHYPLTPMAPMSFVLGLSIAVICDLDLRVANGWARRALEGMLCGAAMVVGIFICTHMADLPTTTLEHISLWFPFVFAFSLGFGSGFFAPYLYRRALSEESMAPTIAHPGSEEEPRNRLAA